MPSPKRWFALSRDINDDPEFDELCEKFKTGGIRVWLEVLSILNKTSNEWVLLGDFCKSLSRKCKTNRRTVVEVLHWCCDKRWLTLTTVEQQLNDTCTTLAQQRYAYIAPNYLKYNRTREPKGIKPVPDMGASLHPTQHNTTRHNIKTPDTVSPKPKKARKEIALTWRTDIFGQLWDEYPNGNGKRKAAMAWENLKPDDALINQIQTALPFQRESAPWLKNGGEFVPMFSTYLNERRWEDKLKPSSTKRERLPL